MTDTARIMMAAFLATATLSLSTGAIAQRTTLEGDVRSLVPKRAESLNPEAQVLQQRIIDHGFFSWPAVREKVSSNQINRPREVSECPGHHHDYKPAHQFDRSEDFLSSQATLTRTFVYEWFAYKNAIINKDCSCNSLSADWNNSVDEAKEILDGFTDPRIFTMFTIKARNGIKNEFDRMCDIRMNLNLG